MSVCVQLWNSLDEPCFAGRGADAFKLQINSALLFGRSLFPFPLPFPIISSLVGVSLQVFFNLQNFSAANILPVCSCYWHMCYRNDSIIKYQLLFVGNNTFLQKHNYNILHFIRRNERITILFFGNLKQTSDLLQEFLL